MINTREKKRSICRKVFEVHVIHVFLCRYLCTTSVAEQGAVVVAREIVTLPPGFLVPAKSVEARRQTIKEKESERGRERERETERERESERESPSACPHTHTHVCTFTPPLRSFPIAATQESSIQQPVLCHFFSHGTT